MTDVLSAKLDADELVRIARIIARNVDDERYYSAPPFQRAAQEILSSLSLPITAEPGEVDGWKGMASRSSIAAAIAAEDRRLLLEDGRALLDTLPPDWHDEATTNFRDLVGSIEQRLSTLTGKE